MGAFQRQIGDMVELTPEGEKEIHKYKKIIMQMRQNH